MNQTKHGFLCDKDCDANTPVIFGFQAKSVYGTGKEIRPRIRRKRETISDKERYLDKLLPLEEYDKIIVLFSGGKDSLAAYLKLLELGVPKEKIELWHHDIDGGHPDKRMDWPVTKAYVDSFAKAEQVKLRLSWRMNGFWGEVFRIGASMPVQYMGDDEKVKTIPMSKRQKRSEELRQGLLTEEEKEELEAMGYRMKFPAKAGSLMTRWCSAYLKIMVAEAVLRILTSMKEPSFLGPKHRSGDNAKILLVSGERRGESSNRAKYNETELHRSHALKRSHRLVHQWRIVIDHSEKDIWEIIKRHKVNPHPCYRAGWNRCSCMKCIFSLPKHWAGIRELFPDDYEDMCRTERELGFTLDNKKSLQDYVGEAKSCVSHDDDAVNEILTGKFPVCKVYVTDWSYPAGAFKSAAGGPC